MGAVSRVLVAQTPPLAISMCLQLQSTHWHMFKKPSSGHFPVRCKLQAHLHARLIYLVCSNYPVFSGDTLFPLLQRIHLNVTIQDICVALSCFVSKTGVCSLETKGKVSSACCTCRNLAIRSRNTSGCAKMIALLNRPSVVLIIYLLNPATMSGFCQQCTCRK